MITAMPQIDNKKEYMTPPSTPSTLAPGGWFDCAVRRVGPAEDGTIFINLEDLNKAFPARWYPANNTQKTEMLAVALAAITAGLHVHAALTSTDEYYGVINRLYITNVV
ncbi:MAG: hypothetical protein B0A82_08500 [Alkalinema sp. CACIAM 70d]|nr:MAG: hypothetical protein B0A82_08500 [Alkalinema sp. CACIAM 70d]